MALQLHLPPTSQSHETAFSASFTIYSASGAVLVTGTKSFDASVPNTSGSCYNAPNSLSASNIPTTYEATIYTSVGNYQDQGTSTVGYLTSNQTGTSLRESFTSALTQPVLNVPATKDQCMASGYKNYPQFKNQGDCVSFVASGGKNPAG